MFRIVLLCLAAFAARAEAELIVVNTSGDAPDANPADGVCDADLTVEGLQCTLRAAVQHANATPGFDGIQLPAGKFKLTIQGAGEDAAATGDLDVTEDLEIAGAGAGETIIDGKKAKDRILDVADGVSLTIFDLTLQKGKSPQGEAGGGGIRSAGTLLLEDSEVKKCRSADDAGGVYVETGSASLIQCLFRSNRAKDDGGAVDVDDGTLLVLQCAFVKNHAGDEAGAIESSGATATITNSTCSGNVAKNEGGALVNEDGGTMTLVNCTLAKNVAKAGASISTADDDAGTNVTNVRNVLFASKKKKECLGTLTSLGGNLDQGTTCGFGAGDQSGTKPRLKQLAMNGGQTPTHALKADSPCIDAGTDVDAPPADQRSYLRVDVPDVGTTKTDVGAFEFAGLRQIM